MPIRISAIVAVACLGAALLYAAGVFVGAFSIVGYASGSERQQGFHGERWLPLAFGVPLWLPAGSVVRADYDIDAKWGSLSLTVTPPLVLRTSLQAATAYVSGRRRGGMLFVIRHPGWYRLMHDTTPLGGLLCPRQRSMAQIMIGSSDCPTYDVSYRIVWRLADVAALVSGLPRLDVPRPNEALVTHYIGASAIP
jgi:hypothetical protein